MASSGRRLNKRQQRQQQEQEELAAAKGISQDGEAGSSNDSGEEGEDQPSAPSGGIFAQLAQAKDAGDEQTSEEDEDDINSAAPAKSRSRNRRRRNKKKTAASTDQQGQQEADEEGAEPMDAVKGHVNNDADKSTTKGKKKKKKPQMSTQAQAKKEVKQGQDISEMSMDDFSALLASQAQVRSDQGEAQVTNTSAAINSLTGPLIELRSNLALTTNNLDPAVELKRQFGAAAIKAYETEAGANSPSAASGARARALARNPNLKIRSVLVKPKETWPPIAMTFTGMSMELREDSSGRGKIGAWTHSRAYKNVQRVFLQAVASYDPNNLVAILQSYPWHIDTLLQLSDVSRHQGDLGQASDFNSRALFAFERTALPSFTSGLTSQSGPPMLDYASIENRGFWLASHRHVNFLARRGTWRTALEWSKLIIGLNPAVDEHAMLLWLDFLSIKSKQYDWFLKTLKHLEMVRSEYLEKNGDVIVSAKTPFDEADKARIEEAGANRGALEWLPGIAYNKALALRGVEAETGKKRADQSDASSSALRLAIARHPQVLCLLLDKIGAPFPSGADRTHVFFAVDTSGSQAQSTTNLLTHLYIARNESLWRESETAQWLTTTLQQCWPAIEEAHSRGDLARPELTSQAHTNGIARHVLVSDLPDALRQQLIGLLPHSIKSNSLMLDANDPVPPSGPHATRYNDAYFGANVRAQGRMPGFSPDDADDLDEDLEAALARAQAEMPEDPGEAVGWMQRLANMLVGGRRAAVEGHGAESPEDSEAEVVSEADSQHDRD